MLELVASLLPLALGVVMSPLAVMALVAVLVSSRARVNGVAFLIGWVLAIVLAVGGFFWLFGALDVHEPDAAPTWVAVLRLILGVGLLLAAVFVFRRGPAQAKAMKQATTPSDVVEAAPQLPGWLRAVEHFTPTRSLLLGLGIFVLNPVDLSCAVLAALELQLSEVGPTAVAVTAIVFVAIGVLPMAAPVFYTLVQGERAEPVLAAVRGWIASHTNVVNAALLLVIAVLQLQKGVSALL